MKEETKQAIDRVIGHLEAWGSHLYYLKDYTSHNEIKSVIEILNKLPELENKLGHGGLVRDKNGNWLQHDDNVSFYVNTSRDDTTYQYFGQGVLKFIDAELTWYVLSNDGTYYHLGTDYGEIESFWKE